MVRESRLPALSLFSWSVEQNAQTQMTTCLNEGARGERSPSFLAPRGFAAQRSRARALPVLNLKKKRDLLAVYRETNMQRTRCELGRTKFDK